MLPDFPELKKELQKRFELFISPVGQNPNPPSADAVVLPLDDFAEETTEAQPQGVVPYKIQVDAESSRPDSTRSRRKTLTTSGSGQQNVA